jgi:hypothetical protein
MYYFHYPFFQNALFYIFSSNFQLTGFQLFICVKQLKFLLFYKKNLKNIITDQTSIYHISIKAINHIPTLIFTLKIYFIFLSKIYLELQRV